jgi:hypothetical protein
MKVGDLVEFIDKPSHLPTDIHRVGVVVEVYAPRLKMARHFGVGDSVRVLWDNGDREREHPPKLRVVKT